MILKGPVITVDTYQLPDTGECYKAAAFNGLNKLTRA
jgi:hypothetical protein